MRPIKLICSDAQRSIEAETEVQEEGAKRVGRLGRRAGNWSWGDDGGRSRWQREFQTDAVHCISLKLSLPP